MQWYSNDCTIFIDLTYLINIVKVCLHTLDSDVFVGFGGLRLEDFGEGALALLANQPILCTSEISNSNRLLKFVFQA